MSSSPSANGKLPVAELALDLVQGGVQLVALGSRDDVLRREHRRVCARLLDVVGPEAPVERQRVVQRAEGRVLRLGETRHGELIIAR